MISLTVLSARNIGYKSKPNSTLPSPFCRIEHGHDNMNPSPSPLRKSTAQKKNTLVKFKTKPVKRTLNPDWYYTCEFQLEPPNFRISVEDANNGDFLGQVVFNGVDKIPLVDDWFRLVPKDNTPDNYIGGELHIVYSFIPKTHSKPPYRMEILQGLLNWLEDHQTTSLETLLQSPQRMDKDNTTIRQIYTQFYDLSCVPNFDMDINDHLSVIALLKLYLREMDPILVPHNMFIHLIEAIRMDFPLILQTVKIIVQKLPQVNRTGLMLLIGFAHRLAKHADSRLRVNPQIMGSVLGPLLVKNLEGNMIGHEDQLIEYLVEHYNDIWDKDDEFEVGLKRENSKKTKVLRFMIFFPGGKKVVRFDPDRKLFPILERMASSYNLDLSQYTIHDGHNVQIDNDRDLGSIDGMCVTLRIKEILVQPQTPVTAHRRASVRITKLEMNNVPVKPSDDDNRPQSVRKHIQVSSSKSARLLSVRNVKDLTPLLNSMKGDHDSVPKERRKSVTGLRYVPNMGKLQLENEEELERELDIELTGLENQLKIFDDEAETLSNKIKILKEERNELITKLQLLYQTISITIQDIKLMNQALEHLSLSS